ncbi:hypothetical protein C0995_010149, partial [Termitomyces sp. Mi166
MANGTTGQGGERAGNNRVKGEGKGKGTVSSSNSLGDDSNGNSPPSTPISGSGKTQTEGKAHEEGKAAPEPLIDLGEPTNLAMKDVAVSRSADEMKETKDVVDRLADETQRAKDVVNGALGDVRFDDPVQHGKG